MQITLKAARVNAGYTQEQIARKLRKSKQTIVNWELGRTAIDQANLAFICDIYNVPKDCILLPINLTLSQ